ncbi:hypothetical protein [Sabulicella glaciei]|uniref:Uncharacterized protein n=1 Tax=Sabulicella glaciei TaxID=2984948 RepID=A0ABT3NV69_9PROT|nr:hypothetical protein [Roseococcus sp. MDT2-1-1]MCW8086047.1 hypothetical protein [Roseococcus sp. MDT2-1-1]
MKNPDGGLDRLERLVAEALAREAGTEPSPAHADMARRLLAEHAFLHLHNRVAEIRREAVDEHLGRLRSPLGFWGAVGASLLALALAGGLALFLASQPALLDGLRLLPGSPSL